MIQSLLQKISDDQIIGVNQIVSVTRHAEITTDDDENNEITIENGSIMLMSNGDEIVLNEDQTDLFFVTVIEQNAAIETLKRKLFQ
jgi:hypothetical protein